MLIIFDLDDTLIETSICLTPYFLKSALKKMIDSGLEVRDFSESYTRLLNINERSLFSKDALTEFCQLQPKFLKVGLEAMKGSIPDDLELFPVDGAISLLEELQNFNRLALVTRGEEAFQMQKVEKAGLQQMRFSKIVVSRGSSKKEAYEEIIFELGEVIEDVWVCGDRVALDLSPAKELGCWTVHFKNGRGKIDQGPKDDVDFSIEKLEELKGIVTRHENKNSYK